MRSLGPTTITGFTALSRKATVALTVASSPICVLRRPPSAPGPLVATSAARRPPSPCNPLPASSRCSPIRSTSDLASHPHSPHSMRRPPSRCTFCHRE
jgi:hypothetical protein